MVEAITNDFAENCYILSEGKEAYVIDPGTNYYAMKDYIREKELVVLGVLLTHGHYDHIAGLNDLLDDFDAPIYIHVMDRDFLFDPNLNLSAFMSDQFKLHTKHRVQTLKNGDALPLGKETIKVIHTPGHTRGGVSFHYKQMLFTGDCLFKETIGRTDLPTGDHDAIIKSVKKLVKTFEPNTLIYPGHGHFTTIAHEKRKNPYLKSA